MKAHATTALYAAAWTAVPVALIVGFALAPWATGVVVLVAVVAGVCRVLRIPSGPA